MCATDRPFTDSEVRFLKYIRQWGKKVVFLVNKVDILSSSNEVNANLCCLPLHVTWHMMLPDAFHHSSAQGLSVLLLLCMHGTEISQLVLPTSEMTLEKYG